MEAGAKTEELQRKTDQDTWRNITGSEQTFEPNRSETQKPNRTKPLLQSTGETLTMHSVFLMSFSLLYNCLGQC